MKKSRGLFVAFLIGISISACSLLGGPIAEKVADVISDYCKEPLQARELYRDTVNQELAAEGHSIQVQCAGDPDTTGAIGGPGDNDIVAAVIAYCEAPGVAPWSTRHDVAVQCRDGPGQGS